MKQKVKDYLTFTAIAVTIAGSLIVGSKMEKGVEQKPEENVLEEVYDQNSEFIYSTMYEIYDDYYSDGYVFAQGIY